MRFYGQSTDKDVIDYLSDTLISHLSRGEKVLWLLSGGSAIRIETATAKLLAGIDRSRLVVSLFDERYGEPGHADSNWRQLKDAGFDLPQAGLHPVLSGANMQATAESFADFLKKSLTEADFAIGLAGIGPDGHTLGIKPGSPSLETDDLVSAYDWDDYRRITATAKVISEMDEIVVFAFGQEKKEQLENLQAEQPAAEQPAQLLKLCDKVKIFSDQVLKKS